MTWVTVAAAEIPELSQEHWQWLGERVFTNECNRRESCLTAWNAGEEFPSLGIGHFIWYPQGSTGPFEATFPALIRHLQSQGVALPDWLPAALTRGAPWPDRASFLAQQDSPKMLELRRLLRETQREQVQFIVLRLQQALPELLAYFPDDERDSRGDTLNALAAAAPPYGLYALIDYVHFKGTGLHASERYAGQGWGLVQVLEAMPPQSRSLDDFIQAAAAVLRRRVSNAPAERNEQRWLQGWLNRLNSYQPPAAGR